MMKEHRPTNRDICLENGIDFEAFVKLGKFTGFICAGPESGWCEKVHQNEYDARECLLRDRAIRACNPPRSDRAIIHVIDGEFQSLLMIGRRD